VGIIKGYKREVRLRLQEVVDFRNTPNLSSVPSPSASGTTTPPPPPPSSSANAAAIAQPATAGNVVYFRID
jgi:hypothetical protein